MWDAGGLVWTATILAYAVIAVALIVGRRAFNLIRQVLEHEEALPHSAQLAASKASSRSGLARPTARGESRHWVKSKNPEHPAVKREAEEDWAR